MIKTYKKMLRRLEILQEDLMLIENYPEDDYQALQRAIEHFEDKLEEE